VWHLQRWSRSAAATDSSLRSGSSAGTEPSGSGAVGSASELPGDESVVVVVGTVVSGTLGSGATVVDGAMIVASTVVLSGNPAMATPAPIANIPTMT
jgi:hypothetical protein